LGNAASKRYWKRDVIVPAVEVSERGIITVNDRPGFGYDVDSSSLNLVTVRTESLG
jgi:O-succinylbenzoate synthase